MSFEDIRLVAKETTALSPWATLTTRTIEAPWHTTPQEFHSLRPHDYVTVLAVTTDGRIPLVRQYRPTLELVTTELPGGLLDSGSDPLATATRELEEETGYAAPAPLQFLGDLSPDTGRLENRIWCYFAADVEIPDGSPWHPEPDVERVLFKKEELRRAILDGQFDHALHIAVIGMAMMRGFFQW